MSTYDKEQIIRYVDGELSAEEKLAMEAALREDPALAAEVALCRELKAALQERLVPDTGVEALRGTLQGMNRKYFGAGAETAMEQTGGQGERKMRGDASERQPVKGRVFPLRKYLVGLAAAAVVFFAVMRLWPSGSYMDRYGKTEMFSNTERGEGNDSIMTQAAAYFNAQDYAKALPLLEQAFRADSSNLTALFYRGVARLHTGAVGDGRKDLERIYTGSSVFKYEAAFYLALSYAEAKNKTAAEEWLEKIPEGAAVSDKAQELRKKLK